MFKHGNGPRVYKWIYIEKKIWSHLMIVVGQEHGTWNSFPYMLNIALKGRAIKHKQGLHPFSPKSSTIENSFAAILISSLGGFFVCIFRRQTNLPRMVFVSDLIWRRSLLLATSLLFRPFTIRAALNESKSWNMSITWVCDSLELQSHNYQKQTGCSRLGRNRTKYAFYQLLSIYGRISRVLYQCQI